MSYLTWKMRGLSAAFAVIGSVGFVSNADAIISRKVWDPQYGAALPNLGWSGEVDFEIKPDCLATVTDVSKWVYFGSAGCNQLGSLGIKSATVNLFDLVLDVNGVAQKDVDGRLLNGAQEDVKLTYKAGSVFAGGNRDIVPRMWIDVAENGDKSIGATQGFYLFPEITNAPFATVAGYDAAAFWLSFAGTQKNNQLNFANTAPQGDFAFLDSCSFNYPATFDLQGKLNTLKGKSCSSNDSTTYPAILVAVPEPETYLLGLASFGVLGVWARRRRLSGR